MYHRITTHRNYGDYVDLLLKAKDYEESGIAYLEKAAKQWRSSSR